MQVGGKSQPSGSGDNRRNMDRSQFIDGTSEKIRQCFLYICKMAFVIGEQNFIICSQDCDFYRGGTNNRSLKYIIRSFFIVIPHLFAIVVITYLNAVVILQHFILYDK